MAKAKFPNPAFWRYKDHIDWKAQGKNLKEVGGIIGDMLKETDWVGVAARYKKNLLLTKDRIVDEAKAVAKMTNAERIDLVLNGEKHLGRLYRSGCMATVRREWRGVGDTAYDFYEWVRMWGMFLTTFGRDLIPAMNATLYYRWMISYFCAHSFMDKNTLGQRAAHEPPDDLRHLPLRRGEPRLPRQVRREERQRDGAQ